MEAMPQGAPSALFNSVPGYHPLNGQGAVPMGRGGAPQTGGQLPSFGQGGVVGASSGGSIGPGAIGNYRPLPVGGSAMGRGGFR